jgi:hypothetical protein
MNAKCFVDELKRVMSAWRWGGFVLPSSRM